MIENELGPEWIGLHSVGLTQHAHKPWAEIDFVLIGPPGVFCLEVKGGRVERRDGMWHYIDGQGNVDVKYQGPFDQVAGANGALGGYLRGQVPHLRDMIIGFGVVVPDMEFRPVGCDYDPEVVYDIRDRDKPFTSYMRRLANHWTDHWERRGSRPPSLDHAQRKEVFDQIRRDFDARPSLASQISRAGGELIRLTQEECHVLDALSDNPRVVITGGAGTGKTFLAVEEARRHAKAGKRVFLGCFNRSLANYLRLAIADERKVVVAHLHGYMKEKIDKAGLAFELPDARPEDLLAIFYPEVFQKALEQLDELEAFDVLILDEGQDLLQATYLEAMDTMLVGGLKDGRWMMTADPNQDVYDRMAAEWRDLIRPYSHTSFRLTMNCRNTRPIATANRIMSGFGDGLTLKVEGPDVEQCFCRDEGQVLREVGKCLSRLLSAGIAAADIVVLGRRNLKKLGWNPNLPGCPFQLSDVETDLASRTIRYSTIASYKGLEAEAVIVVDVPDLGLEQQKLLYVAMSRARTFLAIFLPESCQTEYQALAFEYGRALTQGQRDS